MSNTPNMNITNQINAALNDIRESMIALATWAKSPDLSDQIMLRSKIRYQTDLAVTMIDEHRQGISIPWSDRKHMVDEEFSDDTEVKDVAALSAPPMLAADLDEPAMINIKTADQSVEFHPDLLAYGDSEHGTLVIKGWPGSLLYERGSGSIAGVCVGDAVCEAIARGDIPLHPNSELPEQYRWKPLDIRGDVAGAPEPPVVGSYRWYANRVGENG